MSVEAFGTELNRVVKGMDEWDHKVCRRRITNISERTVEARARVSEADASSAWDLRCKVREKLIEFVQKNYPLSLPRFRAELDKSPNNSGQSA